MRKSCAVLQRLDKLLHKLPDVTQQPGRGNSQKNLLKKHTRREQRKRPAAGTAGRWTGPEIRSLVRCGALPRLGSSGFWLCWGGSKEGDAGRCPQLREANTPAELPKGLRSAGKRKVLQLFVPWEEGNNRRTLAHPLLKGDGSRFPPRSSHGSWWELRDAPEPAPGSSRMLHPDWGGQGAVGHTHPHPPAWHQPGKSSFLFSPRSWGRGMELAEARPQQQRFLLSREGQEVPAGEPGHGGETSSGPLGWIRCK